MSKTASININGLEQGSMAKSISIERTFPAILDGYMSQSEWASFCDEVDKHLAPLGGHRDTYFRKRKILWIPIVIFLIFIGIYFGMLNKNGTTKKDPGLTFMVPIVAFSTLLGINYCLGNKFFNNFWVHFEKMEKEVQRVLSDESAKRSNVSFHTSLKEDEERPVIECIVSSGDVEAGGVVSPVGEAEMFTDE